MLESEELRKQIEEIYEIDLLQYAWNEEEKEDIFSIQLDKDYEDKVNTMKEVYEQGLNIGNCGLTSRYFARHIKNSDMNIGKCKLLRGTLNAPNGEHAWITLDNFVIDTTLMIMIPEEVAEKLGYQKEKTLAKDSAKMLPEYNTYSNTLRKKKSL